MAERHTYEISFGRGREIKYIGHLDMMRLWERLLRRAGLPLAYSEGFNPRPRLALAAPLAVGVLALNDILEIVLTGTLPVSEMLSRLREHSTPGLAVNAVAPVPANRPSLQARMREAHYVIALPDDPAADYGIRLEKLLARETIPLQYTRKGKKRERDLRPLILEASIEMAPPFILRLRLRQDQQETGRPMDVLQALAIDPALTEITRTALVLAPA